jgi:signal-transduction protein with cAMP-binding, CBS, and nucleotidyltransferase domain
MATLLDELGNLMLEYHVNRIPIVRDGKPVGIVTRSDVLRGLFRTTAPVPERGTAEPVPA